MISLLVCAVLAGFASLAAAPTYAVADDSPASITTEPKANTLTYNAAKQKLVTKGAATGGTMYYALGGNRTDAPADPDWSTEIPEGKNAEIYYVWYKAKGDDGHSDSAPGCAVARIAKRPVKVIAKDQEYEYVAKNWWQGPGDAVYDDPAQVAEMVTVIGLQGEDRIANVTVDGQGDVPGVYPLIPTSAPIVDSYDTVVTDNYEREYIDGKLIIYVTMEVTITGSSTAKTYNGKAQAYKGTVTATSSDTAFDASMFHYTGNTTVKGTKAGGYALKLEPKYCTYDDRTHKPIYTIANPIRLTIKPGANTDDDTPVATTVSGVPLAKLKAKGSKALVLTWIKVKGATGYDIFFGKCSKKDTKASCKRVKTVKGNKSPKWTKKRLKKKTAYKAYVRAFVKKNGKKKYVGTSPMVHAYTSKGTKTYTNAKSVTVKKTKVKLKKGKTFKIKAKVNKLKKGKKLMPKAHAAKLRYVSSDKKIATVSKSGKIKAKAKGSCKVYVLAVNGVNKAIKVKVN